MNKGVLSPEELADFLGIHPQTVYKLLRNGELPGKKSGSYGGSLKTAWQHTWRMAKLARKNNLLNLKNQTKQMIPVVLLHRDLAPGRVVDKAAPANVAEDQDRYLVESLEEESKS